jgi:hypothetical protein
LAAVEGWEVRVAIWDMALMPRMPFRARLVWFLRGWEVSGW